MKTKLIVFARSPLLGAVKSRLAEGIGVAQALSCHLALLRNALTAARAAGLEAELAIAGDCQQPRLVRLAQAANIPIVEQSDGDIGARMCAAAMAAAAVQHASIIIGSDCVGMTPEYLRNAARALHNGDDVVIGPAADGGYLLIGQRLPQPELFQDIAWGTPSVLAQTRARLAKLSLSSSELPTLWDVDAVADWRRWIKTLAACSKQAARRCC